MATLGTQALTLSDLRKRLAPDGSVDFIIEALLSSNPIMDDIAWKMGNLPTGNRTTIRTSMPKPSVRRINRGVTRHKSTTMQVQDTCIILEDRSCVDIEEIALAPNGEQFRRSEGAKTPPSSAAFPMPSRRISSTVTQTMTSTPSTGFPCAIPSSAARRTRRAIR